MEPLTDRQAEVLRLVRELTEVSGYPPTRAEIAEKMGFRSVNAAEQHLRALEKKGAIEISSGASRGLRVRDGRMGGRAARLLELPVVGRVAAGAPMLAEENLQGHYQVDPNLFTPRADYLLRVRGLSMRDAGARSTAAAVTADIRGRADPALVRADRVEQLYSQLPLGMVATVVIGVIAAIELHEGRLIELVYFWGGLLGLVVILHGLLYLGYRNDARRHENAAQWLRWLGIGAFAAGAVWGFAAAVFFPSHADERQVFMAFLLA